jgi:hypothetical protein
MQKWTVLEFDQELPQKNLKKYVFLNKLGRRMELKHISARI